MNGKSGYIFINFRLLNNVKLSYQVDYSYENLIITELEHIPPNLIAVEGFPDVGLVGTISATFLVEQLKMRPAAFIRTELLPPVQSVKMGVAIPPAKIFVSDKLLVMTSDIPVPPQATYDFAMPLLEWLKQKRISLLVSINGFPYEGRLDVTEPKTLAIANNPDYADALQKAGVELLEEGILAGIGSVLLSELARAGINAVSLVAQSFPNYPDPGAAASALKVFSKITGIQIDTKPLLEKANELRLNLLELAERTKVGRAPTAGAQPTIYR